MTLRESLDRLKGRRYIFGHISDVSYPCFEAGRIVYAGFEISMDRGFVDGLTNAVNQRIQEDAVIKIIALEEGHTKSRCLAEIIPATSTSALSDYKNEQTKQLSTEAFLSHLPHVLNEIDRSYALVKANIKQQKPKKAKEWRGKRQHYHPPVKKHASLNIKSD